MSSRLFWITHYKARDWEAAQPSEGLLCKSGDPGSHLQVGVLVCTCNSVFGQADSRGLGLAGELLYCKQ